MAKTEPVEYRIISCLHYFHTGFSKFMKNSYFCSDKVKYSGYGNPMWLKTKVNLFSVNWFKFMIIFHRTNCLRILNPYDVFGSLKSSILCYTQRSSLKIFYSKNKAKHHGKVLGWKVLIWWVKISKQKKNDKKTKRLLLINFSMPCQGVFV